MSERTPPLLSLSTKHLSADGGTVRLGEEHFAVDVTAFEARAALTAFAAVPAMALVDVDAKIYLTGPEAKVAVQNVGGRLFVTLVPEAVNTATERTPEQTVAMVTRGDPGAAADAVGTDGAHDAERESEISARAKRDARGWRGVLRSKWTLVALVAIAVAIGFWNFAPKAPEGVDMIRDPAKTAALHATLNGRYGVPAATMLVLENGRLTGVKPGPAGAADEKVFALSYRFGQRGEQTVIVASNGALVERQGDGSLKFLESVYPPIAK
jgi:hypothetical protein